VDDPQPTPRARRAWFRPNRSGPGWHPSSWQGWSIVVLAVALLVTVVVVVRTGLL